MALILPLNAGELSYTIHKVDTGALFGEGELHLVNFHERACTLSVEDNGSMTQPEHVDLLRAVSSNRGVAGINGGFFAREGYPLGLVIDDGKRIGSVSCGSSLVAGVVYVSESGPGLMRSEWFKQQQHKLPGLTQALQGGPFLLEKGKCIRGLSKDKRRARTFIMTDGMGSWSIGCCSAVTLSRLSEILSDPANTGGLRVVTALNLDGGSSSCLVWKGAWKRRNAKSVRNYLIVIPKS